MLNLPRRSWTGNVFTRRRSRRKCLKSNHLVECLSNTVQKNGTNICTSGHTTLSWHWLACEFCCRSFLPRPVKGTGRPMGKFTLKSAAGSRPLRLRSSCMFIPIGRPWKQLLLLKMFSWDNEWSCCARPAVKWRAARVAVAPLARGAAPGAQILLGGEGRWAQVCAPVCPCQPWYRLKKVWRCPASHRSD